MLLLLTIFLPMSSSLKDQLLKAGLVTEEQVADSEKKPAKKGFNKNKRPKNQEPKKPNRPSKPKISKEKTDLEKFYAERDKQDRQEKQAEQKRQQEQAALKKERKAKVKKLIEESQLPLEDEEGIRYNFVVGTTVKYLFISETQQKQLEAGELAITFNGGSRCLIPTTVGLEIMQVDPNKIVIFTDQSSEPPVEEEKPTV